MLQTQDLRVGQKKKPYIGFIQENWIENSVQDLSTLYTKSAWSMLSLSSLLLWQPLDTKSNNHTMSKSLKVDI